MVFKTPTHASGSLQDNRPKSSENLIHFHRQTSLIAVFEVVRCC